MNNKKRLSVGVLFIAAGMLFGYTPFMNYRESKAQFVAQAQAVKPATIPVVKPEVKTISGTPIRIVIPASNIDISVVDGFYNEKNKTWTLTGDKAQYAVMTPPANNQSGNTFIYGHNNRKVFSRLNKVVPGDKVTIQTDNGHTFVYQFVSAYETNPNDDTLFNYNGVPKLTLQTCSGLFYQNRKLFSFALVSAS